MQQISFSLSILTAYFFVSYLRTYLGRNASFIVIADSHII